MISLTVIITNKDDEENAASNGSYEWRSRRTAYNKQNKALAENVHLY